MQWYDPSKNFMLLKRINYPVPTPLRVFEFYCEQHKIYPSIIIGVYSGHNHNTYKFQIVEMKENKQNLRQIENYDDLDHLNVINVTQIDKDSILLCHDTFVKILGLDGVVKQQIGKTNTLQFEFLIDSIIYMHEQDSVIAFHKHGLQARSFKENDVKLFSYFTKYPNLSLKY